MKCLVCEKEQEQGLEFQIVKVLGYEEQQTLKEKRSSNMYDNESRQKSLEKVVLLEEPGQEIAGSLCKACLAKKRRKNYWGIGLSLLGAIAMLIIDLMLNGVPGLFTRIGLFLSLVLVMIFLMPLFRSKKADLIDQLFQEARSQREEPVISLQELDYYFGRKVTHSLMLRQDHWQELDQEEPGIRKLVL